MIKVSCDKGSVSLHMEGTVPEISADAMTMLSAIYESVFKQDIIQALIFREIVEEHIQDVFVIREEVFNGNSSTRD